MKAFMDESFLLHTPTARHLYEDYAKDMPIIDYHCHISPQQIAEDHRFSTITEAWLGGDHYKWRVMRAQGIDEAYITGGASDWEKFEKWAEIMPMLIGNPLYHWTHLELKRYFGIEKQLNAHTAREIWTACNEKLQEPEMTVRGLLRAQKVKCLCTTDDPADSLEYHKRLKAEPDFEIQVLPGWRPDLALGIDSPDFGPYLRRLEAVSGVTIDSFAGLCQALKVRMDAFDRLGCRVCDHGLEQIPCVMISEAEADQAMHMAMEGAALSQQMADGFRTRLMLFLGREYVTRGWVMQLHYGALRNVNRRMVADLGPNTGYDSIGDAGCGKALAGLLNALREADALPKTVVFSLNPNDNDMISSILGCFWEGGTIGKMQLGAAWWFNDTKPGMKQQLVSYASTAVLGNFIGMLTDSRSFLSYTRHEYFRRILADLVGQWVEDGEYPADEEALRAIMEGICYQNAARLLGLM